MKSLNKVQLIGNLGKDPEVRHLDGGRSVANFSVATSDSYTDKSGNKHDTTEWHNVVMWGKMAEVAEKYLKKGSRIYVEGKTTNRSWEDKEGNTRYTTEVVARDFLMLGGEGQSGQARSAAKPAAQQPAHIPDGDDGDELPF